MISLNPHYAFRDNNILYVSIGAEHVGEFKIDEGYDVVDMFAASLVEDMQNLDALSLLPGKLTLNTLENALNEISIEDEHGNKEAEWTEIFHDSIKCKFLLKNRSF